MGGDAARQEAVRFAPPKTLPPGADAYVLRVILHDWDDDRAITILVDCRKAMTDDGVLLIVERVAQEAARSDRNPLVFPGARPRKPLSAMAMSMLLKRLGVPATVHGYRSSFRTWAGETSVVFEVAEHCLAHTVGNQASQSYNQTTLFDLRRPVMSAWAKYVCGTDTSNVLPLRRSAT